MILDWQADSFLGSVGVESVVQRTVGLLEQYTGAAGVETGMVV